MVPIPADGAIQLEAAHPIAAGQSGEDGRVHPSTAEGRAARTRDERRDAYQMAAVRGSASLHLRQARAWAS